MWPSWAGMVNEGKQGRPTSECGTVHVLPDEMAEPGPLSCRDAKKFDSEFVFRGPDHPNLRDENRTGRLRDCQIEIPETSYGQHLCAAEFAPALGQVKGHPIANMLEAICC